MNRKLLVTLLQKDIQELEMITEGFMEMNEYPKPIILLAQRKTEDIQSYINQLSDLKVDTETADIFERPRPYSEPAYTHETPAPAVPVFEAKINTDTTEELYSEIETVLESESEQPGKDVIKENEILATTIDQITEITVPEVIAVAERSENISVTTITEINDDVEITKSTESNEYNGVIEVIEVKEHSLAHELETKTVVDESKKIILGEKNTLTTSLNELLSKADTSISSTLGNKKVSDIKQAISIGERFRFQRELFRGNGEDMNKTLTYLNLLATFEEAKSFLQSKYGWTSENETADDFYQIVKRRFI